ncbi:MAG TPA: iron chelate uptake ABC transporter family permease subunit, partial [Oligoflexia bacterium]|nr:iron chelate uptake ABC transporter family permease subunit [Oligoflexia bacterium]
GGAGTGILAVYTVHLISRHTRLPEDAAIGAVLSVFFGVGVLLLSIIQSLGTGAEGGLHHFIYGQTAAMSINDAKLTALLALFSAAAALLLLKEFRLLCFDPVFALVQGWPVALLDLLMMALVVLVTVTGLQSVGIILVIALLIIPPAAARFWGEKLSFLLLLSAFIGGLSGYLGAGISALLPRMPAGAIIVLVSSGVFLLSFLFAPRRGLVAALIRRLSIRLRVTSEHILRRLYEECERRGSDVHPHIPRSVIDPRRPRLSDSLILWLLRRRGLLSSSSALDSLEFTQAGLAEAARLVRNHRLWEEYVHRFGELAVSHVDYSADFVEHAISPEIVAELE